MAKTTTKELQAEINDLQKQYKQVVAQLQQVSSDYMILQQISSSAQVQATRLSQQLQQAMEQLQLGVQGGQNAKEDGNKSGQS